MSYFSEQLQQYLKKQSIITDRVVDIGGAQKPARKQVKLLNCKEYKIADLPTPHEKVADVDIEIDLNTYYTNATFNEYFDFAFCLEVFEYIYDPLMALRNINLFLKKGGDAIITFPFVYPAHNPVSKDFLRYTPLGAMKLLEMSGFTIIESVMRVGKAPELLQTFYKTDGMHVAGYSDCTGMIFLVKKQ